MFTSLYRVVCTLTCFILFFCFAHASAQYDWKLNTQKDGITVYTSTVPTSKVKAVKVVCTFNATAAELVGVLMDVKGCTEWVYHTKSCVLVKQASVSDLYYYSEISVPWPVENRDFVAHLLVTQDPKTKVVTVNGPAVPGHVPEKKGMVRIHESVGKWVITPMGKDAIKVEYSLQVDPGGNVPAWLVNLFAAEGPIQSFKKLKLQLEKPVYKNPAAYRWVVQ